MRELTMDEMQQVGGGNSGAGAFTAVVTAFKVGWEAGSYVYENMDTETQDAVGGTVDQMLINTGLKS